VRNLVRLATPHDAATAHVAPYEVRLIAVSTPDHGPDWWANSDTILTFVWGMPTTHLAEANTHRAHSRGTASARAIPSAAFAKNVTAHTVYPMRPGENNPGMSSRRRLDLDSEAELRTDVAAARDYMLQLHEKWSTRLHKQVVNRWLDPWSYKPQVVTVSGGKPLTNLLYTRMDYAADPAFRVQAVGLWRLLRDLQPAASSQTSQNRLGLVDVSGGDYPHWHLPYAAEVPSDALVAAFRELATQDPDRWGPFWETLMSYGHFGLFLGGFGPYIDANPVDPAHTIRLILRALASVGACGRVSTLTQDKAPLAQDIRLGIEMITGIDVRKVDLCEFDPRHRRPMHPSPSEHQARFLPEDRRWPDYRGNLGPSWVQLRKCLHNEATSGSLNPSLHAETMREVFDAMLTEWDRDA
jgi:hypothetical protein